MIVSNETHKLAHLFNRVRRMPGPNRRQFIRVAYEMGGPLSGRLKGFYIAHSRGIFSGHTQAILFHIAHSS